MDFRRSAFLMALLFFLGAFVSASPVLADSGVTIIAGPVPGSGVVIAAPDPIVAGGSQDVVFADPAPHALTAPVIESADTPVELNTQAIVCVGGSVCSLGHSVEYLVELGDGNTTPWSAPAAAAESICAQHAWQATGTYEVRAMARCATDPAVESPWSASVKVTVTCSKCPGASSSSSGSSSDEGGGGGCFIRAILAPQP